MCFSITQSVQPSNSSSQLDDFHWILPDLISLLSLSSPNIDHNSNSLLVPSSDSICSSRNGSLTLSFSYTLCQFCDVNNQISIGSIGLSGSNRSHHIESNQDGLHSFICERSLSDIYFKLNLNPQSCLSTQHL